MLILVHALILIVFYFDMVCLAICFAFPTIDCTSIAACLEHEKIMKERQSHFPISLIQEIINCIHKFFPYRRRKKSGGQKCLTLDMNIPTQSTRRSTISRNEICVRKHTTHLKESKDYVLSLPKW